MICEDICPVSTITHTPVSALNGDARRQTLDTRG
jgi:hypothetical protein